MNNVDTAQFIYYGNDYRCDLDTDGLVTQDELAICAVDILPKISRVDIALTMSAGDDTPHEFVGQAWLRNRSVIEDM